MGNKKGFSLLELLAVVLFIGILAAIALPQYRRAVAKAEAAQLYEMVASLRKTVQGYYVIHDKWPTKLEELDLEYKLPIASGSVCASSNVSGGIMRNEKYELLIHGGSNFAQVSARFADGPYKCTGFSTFFEYPGYPNLENKFVCYEKPEGSQYRGVKNKKGDFCEKVMGYRFFMTNGGDANFFIY